MAATFAERSGDPLLTGIDSVARRLGRGRVAKHDRRMREAREDPVVPDQIFRGAHLGIDADQP